MHRIILDVGAEGPLNDSLKKKKKKNWCAHILYEYVYDPRRCKLSTIRVRYTTGNSGRRYLNPKTRAEFNAFGEIPL